MVIAVLKKSRSTAKAKSTRLRNNIFKAVREVVLEDTIKKRFSELKLAWDEVQRFHEQYVNQLDDYKENEEEKWIAGVFNEYESAEITVDNYLFELREKDSEVEINRYKKIKGQKQEDIKFRNSYQSIKGIIVKAKTQSESMVKVARVTEKRL